MGSLQVLCLGGHAQSRACAVVPLSGTFAVMLVIKSASARRANRLLERIGQRFWQDESFDHWVRDDRERRRIIRYIEANPVEAGLVAAPEDWRWSSARARPAHDESVRQDRPMACQYF